MNIKNNMTKVSNVSNVLWYVLTPLVLVGLGFGSSFLTNSGNSNQWYAKLPQAPWTPPGWVFSVVWSILYILLGLVLARTIVEKAWKTKLDKVEFGILLFSIVLILAWPFAYFLAKSQVAGVVLISLIVVLGLVYCIMTGMEKKWLEMGGVLPLLVWGSFATTLAMYALIQSS